MEPRLTGDAQLAALMMVAACASPEAVAQAEPLSLIEELRFGLVPPSELDDFDLAEAAEAGVYIPGLLDELRRRAALLTDDELLCVEPFEGDDGDIRVLSSKVVRGRREHRDHRETIWMAWAGGFGSQELAKQVSA